MSRSTLYYPQLASLHIIGMSGYSNRGGSGGPYRSGGRNYESAPYYSSSRGRGRGGRGGGYYKNNYPPNAYRSPSYGSRNGYNDAPPPQGRYYYEDYNQPPPNDQAYYQQEPLPLPENTHNEQQQPEHAAIEKPTIKQSYSSPHPPFESNDSYGYRGGYNNSRRGSYRGGYRGTGSREINGNVPPYGGGEEYYNGSASAPYYQGRPGSNGYYQDERPYPHETPRDRKTEEPTISKDIHQPQVPKTSQTPEDRNNINSSSSRSNSRVANNETEVAKVKAEEDLNKSHWMTRLTLPADLKKPFSKMFEDLEAHNKALLEISEKKFAIEVEAQKLARLSKSEELRCQLTEEKLEAINFI